MQNIATYENFYPYIVKNPELYIKKNEAVVSLLIELRKRGKGLFLASNSCYDFCNLIMTTAFGPAWKSLFDLCITASGKPGFFGAKVTPFSKLDTSKYLFCGEQAGSPLEIGQTYVNGNYKELEVTFERYLNKKDLKCIYVGDNYLSDCYSVTKLKNWECIAVVEELASNTFC